MFNQIMSFLQTIGSEILSDEENLKKDRTALKLCLASEKNTFFSFFDKEAWTEENILLFFKSDYAKNNNYSKYILPKALKEEPICLTVCLENNIISSFEKFDHIFWNEKNKEIFINYLKENDNMKIPTGFQDSYSLKRLIEERIMIFDTMYWKDTDWTEENINLLGELIKNGESNINILRYIYKFNYQLSKPIILGKRFEYIKHIDKNSWTNENIDLFLSIANEYFEAENAFPHNLSFSSKFLKYFLEKKETNYLPIFKIEAWTEENIKYYFDNFENITQNSMPYHLKTSTLATKLALKNNYFNHLSLFSPNEVTEDLEMFFIQKYKMYEVVEIPYFLQNSNFLKKLISNNLLYNASLIWDQKAWTEENILLFANALDNYNGKINYKNTILSNSEHVLFSYIKNKRYEAVNMYYYKAELGTKKSKDLLISNIDEYIKKGFSIPPVLFDSPIVLKSCLTNKRFSDIYLFKIEAWTDECLREYANCVFKNELEYKDCPFIIKYSKKLKSMLYDVGCYGYYQEKKEFTSIINYKDDILKSIKGYNAYKKLIDNTNSMKIYLLINKLIDSDYNNLNKYFTENGPNEKLMTELLFINDYRTYCKNNNIEYKKYINNPIIIEYLNFIEIFCDLEEYIYIDSSNVSEYFDHNGVKKNLYDSLFNSRGASYLYKINKKLPKLDKKSEHILAKFTKIEDQKLRKIYLDYCLKNINNIEDYKIDHICEVLRRIENSNATEIRNFKDALADQVLQFENPSEKLKEVEEIFIKNNLPNVAKIFLVFKLLHPDYSNFNFKENSQISPTLKKSSDFTKDIIIFSDLIKITLGSNNRSLEKYIDSLVDGNRIYRAIKNGQKNEMTLTDEEKEIFDIFKKYIEVLYNNSQLGSKNKTDNTESIEDLEELKRLLNPNASNLYDLPDRIISMFCHNAGFDDVNSIKTYINNQLTTRDRIHRNMAINKNFTLKKGDYVKGINNLKYFSNILQNGSLCKEFLGDCADSDATPLDTDLSLIDDNYQSNEQALANTIAKNYGSTYLVLKADSRFTITRTSKDEEQPSSRHDHNIELFKTGFHGNTHYGIRTGFASSEIDYIITKENPKIIGFELALSGIYIPVVDINGNLVFSPEDYDNIRKKMTGLRYYDEKNYNIANDVVRADLEPIVSSLKSNEEEVKYKRDYIIDAIRKKIDLTIKTKLDKDVSPNSIEIIDTGSTGRGTNVPKDGDFDFIVRVDREIMIHDDKLEKLKEQLAESIGCSYTNGDFRFTDVIIPGLDTPVDIDMTFITKTNKMEYSTEMCIKDRLNTIKEQYPDKYDYVLANIIMAKKLSKKYECYKPRHAAKNPQGGLGGVGIENWILQNGGSLMEAARDFLASSEGKTFEEFKNTYSINDFGVNHMSDKKGNYPYDNYIYNLNETGYEKLLQALNDYVLGLVDFNELEEKKEKSNTCQK